MNRPVGLALMLSLVGCTDVRLSNEAKVDFDRYRTATVWLQQPAGPTTWDAAHELHLDHLIESLRQRSGFTSVVAATEIRSEPADLDIRVTYRTIEWAEHDNPSDNECTCSYAFEVMGHAIATNRDGHQVPALDVDLSGREQDEWGDFCFGDPSDPCDALLEEDIDETVAGAMANAAAPLVSLYLDDLEF